jgi:hypothetical protein
MQHLDFVAIADNNTVKSLFAAHAPKHDCTAKNVQNLAAQNKPFRTALTLFINTEIEKEHLRHAHEQAVRGIAENQSLTESLQNELVEAHRFRQLLAHHAPLTLNNTGEKPVKEWSWRDWFDAGTKVITGANNSYVNPEAVETQKEKEEETSNTWIWVAVGGIIVYHFSIKNIMAKPTTGTEAKAVVTKDKAAAVKGKKHTITAADRKKGQEKRARITELARQLALQDNDNAKTVTKTIKVKTVEATKGKLKKSMAAYRKDAECTLYEKCGKRK